jgi:hypothetical protein
MFFSERMAALAKSHGRQPALIDQDVPTTFAELHAQSLHLAMLVCCVLPPRAQPLYPNLSCTIRQP